jgi:hypothetical protein
MGAQSWGGGTEVSWKLKYKMRERIDSRNSNGAVVLVSVVAVIVTELTSTMLSDLYVLFVRMYCSWYVRMY